MADAAAVSTVWANTGKIQRMIIYEIPFESSEASTWYVDSAAAGRKHFDSRQAALAFAVQEALAQATRTGATACIGIQGSDGRWRLFAPDLLPMSMSTAGG